MRSKRKDREEASLFVDSLRFDQKQYSVKPIVEREKADWGTVVYYKKSLCKFFTQHRWNKEIPDTFTERCDRCGKKRT